MPRIVGPVVLAVGYGAFYSTIRFLVLPEVFESAESAMTHGALSSFQLLLSLYSMRWGLQSNPYDTGSEFARFTDRHPPTS
jgi:hypothetical protein